MMRSDRVEPSSLPEQDKDAGDGGQEVPGEGLGAHQPVHVDAGGDADCQALIVWCNLLREHDFKVSCHIPEPC